MAEEIKKKRKKKWWIPVLIIVFILFILPILLVFICFYTPKTQTVKYRENETVTEIANNMFIDCVDDTATTSNLTIDFNEEDLNTMIHGLMSNVPEQVNNFVDKVYIDIQESTYVFRIEAHASFFKTSATLTTKLVDDGENAVFEIKNVKLGRVGVQGLASSLASSVISNEQINDALAAQGLHMSCDLAKLKITYPKKQMIDDVVALTMKDFSSDASLFYVIFGSLLENEMDFSLQTVSSIGVNISLANCVTNENYCTPDKLADYSTILNEKRNMLESWIDNEYVTVENINVGFDYLVYGYDNISSSYQSIVDNDFNLPASWGNKSDYKGIEMGSSKNLEEIMVDSINDKTVTDISTGDLCLLTEDEINDYMKTQRIVGTSFLLHRNTPDGYKINYIMVDNFYINLIDDHAIFVAGVSFNGYETSIIFDTEVYSTNDNKLVFKSTGNNTHFGNKPVADELIEYIFKMLEGTTDSDTFVVDVENKLIAFDFNNVINSPSVRTDLKAIIDASSGLELKARSGLDETAAAKEHLNAAGYIKLKLTF